jgi:polyphenol oxidase
MEPFVYRDAEEIPCFSLELWEKEFPHLTAGFSARRSGEDMDCRNYALHVGNSPERTIENRRRLSRQLGMPPDAWTCGEQVHGVHVEEVTASGRGKGKDSRETAFPLTDGLITGEKGVLLASYYADCVPLYFYSPDREIVGVAHAGWKGTVGGIALRMVDKLKERGAKVERIRVAIGPSIGSCCYEVDERVIRPLEQILNDPERVEKVAVPCGPGKWRLDLKQANGELLRRAGILPEHLVVSGYCTSCHSEYFYSHRRDGGKTGRMVAWIGMRER